MATGVTNGECLYPDIAAAALQDVMETPGSKVRRSHSSSLQERIKLDDISTTTKETAMDSKKRPEVHVNGKLPVKMPLTNGIVQQPMTTPKLYPDVKGLDYDLESFHAAIVNFQNRFLEQARAIAYKGYEALKKGTFELEKHPFFELVGQYEVSRKKLLNVQKRLKHISSDARVKLEKLWITIPREIPVKGKKCDDGSAVDVIYKYEWKELDVKALNDLVSSCHELEKSVIPDLIFEEYATQVASIKLEYFMSNLLKEILSKSDEEKQKSGFSSLSFQNAQMSLKICVSILFHFQRKSSKDVKFISAVRKWLKDLVSVVLHLGTVDDDLFILNNVLRCPSGISSWASIFLQCHPNHIRKCVNRFECLNYSLATFFIIMTPIPGREEFLSTIKSCQRQGSEECLCESCFVVLDSEGEEEHKVQKDWREDDTLSLFSKFSISSLFELSKGSYTVAVHAETEIQKVIALCGFIHEVCLYGLSTHGGERHRRVSEMIGNFICESFRCLAAEWEEFKSMNQSYSCCLQIELDRLFFHALFCMYSTKQSDILMSMEKLPFDCVSPKVLWNFLWIFHCELSCPENNILREKDVERKLSSRQCRSLLLGRLEEFSQKDATYVLRAMKSIAMCRSCEKSCLHTVSKELFEILLSKPEMSTDLTSMLSSLTESNPSVTSSLLEVLSEAEEEQFEVSCDLFATLDLMRWIPTNADMELLSNWLLCGLLSSAKCQLSMSILSGMNWDFKDGELFLPVDMHRRVGCMIVKAYSVYDASASTWFVSRGIEQMLQLYAAIRNQKVESDNGFVAWAWNLLFTLKLHVMSSPNIQWIRIFDGSVVNDDDIPNLNDEELFADLRSAYKEKQPAACFLVLAMTNVGHCIKSLSGEGISIICTLIQLKQYAAAIQALYFALPFFVKHHECLISNNAFMVHFDELIQADGNTTVTGSVLSRMFDMMKIQIQQARQLAVEFTSPLIKLWLQVLAELLLLQNQKVLLSSASKVHHLLDGLIKIAFLHPCTLESLWAPLSPLIERNRPCEERKSIWSFFFGSGIKTTSLIQYDAAASNSAYTWFSWCVILSEVNRKSIKDLWFAVQKELSADPKIVPEMAFKVVASENPAMTFSIHDLPIYRWCMLALTTPVSHHLLPLVYQQFFLYYFQRVNVSGSTHKCVGSKYFTSGLYTAAMKKMNMKLREAVEYYQKAVDSSCSEKVSESTPKDEKSSNDRLKFLKGYQSIFIAFLRWIEDGDLSGPVCFQALNPEYDPERLKLILDCDQKPWFELLDLETIKTEVLLKTSLWRSMSSSCTSSFIGSSSSSNSEECAAKEKSNGIVKLDLTLPSLEKMESFLQELGSVQLSSWSELKSVIIKDQKALSDEANYFQDNIVKLEGMNKKYQDLVKKLYKVNPSTVKLSKPCYRGSRCTGPAKISLTINKITMDEDVKEAIATNEDSFNGILNELCKPCCMKLCMAAVHAEICVSKLVQRLKVTGMEVSKEWCRIGVSLFYNQLLQAETIFQLGYEHAREYPPVKQFFSTCLEVLGRELIAGNEDQLLPLVKVILNHSAIAGLATPFFCPENASASTYLSVYDAVTKSVSPSSACAIFAILTKLKLRKYLEEKNVPFLARKELIHTISSGLINCGSHPQGDVLYVYEALKKQFCVLLMHEFPDLYNDALEILVTGTESGKINADVWYEVFKLLGCPFDQDDHNFREINNEIRKFARNRVLSADQKMYVWSPDLHLSQVLHTLKYLGTYYGEARLNPSTHVYTKYKSYISPISIMLGMMGCSLLDVSYANNVATLGSKTKYVWDLLHFAFKPWIDPVLKEEVLNFPWSPEEKVEARKMFKMFAMCIDFHHTDFKDDVYGYNILSSAWNYYFDTYVQPGIRSYHFNVCHSAFSGIPWEQYHPTHDDVEKMCEVLRCQIPECKKFFSDIFFSIPWLDVMDGLSATTNVYLISGYLSCMAKLVIKFSWECPAGKKGSMQKILRKLEEMPWAYLSTESGEEVMDIYCRLCDPVNLLRKDDKPEVFVLRLLKVVFGMMPVSEMSTKYETTEKMLKQKRIVYLRKLVALLCRTASTDARVVSSGDSSSCSSQFLGLFSQILSELDFIVSKDFYPTEQIAAVTPFVSIVLASLNAIGRSDVNERMLASLLEWLASNPRSFLLLPCIRVSCQSLFNVQSVVSIVECSLTARYETELKNSSEAKEIWYLMSACICIREQSNDEVFTSCIEQNAYLLMYEWICRRMSSCRSAESHLHLLKKIVSSLNGKKPSENAETKLLLVWDKTLKLSLIAAAEGNMQIVKELLVRLSEDLSVLAEDRERGGSFLSSLGLGKGSVYSVNFRFICRALSAFVMSQIPDNADIRLERDSPGHMVEPSSPESDSSAAAGSKTPPGTKKPKPSKVAIKAVDELQYLVTKKPYAALVVHVQKTLKSIYNPSCCLGDCRQILKDLSLQVFPDKSYLYLLNS